MGRLVKGRENQETSLDTEVTGLRGKVEVIFILEVLSRRPWGFFISYFLLFTSEWSEEKMGKIIFITGGARSGKSALAQKLANGLSRKVTYIATAQARDKEMELRIKIHRKNRPSHWKTVEREKNITELLVRIAGQSEVILLDCLTLLISNLLLSGEKKILKEIKQLVNEVKKAEVTVLIVSNEVGMGLVPPYPLGRAYRDLLGKTNQVLAAEADRVYLLVAGLPMDIKGLGAVLVQPYE